MKQKILITCAAMAIMATAGITAFAAGSPYGEAAKQDAATRTVEINHDTKYIDVKSGEVVNFNVGGKTLTWNFDGKSHKSEFDMGLITPSGLLDHQVKIYVDRVPPNGS
jgi:hypothetical protein